jgi:hypothetical protein
MALEIDGKTFEPYANFPGFFVAQSSKAGNTAGDIELKISVPVEGRGEAISLMDTNGEELRFVVMRRVFGGDQA